MSDTPSLLALSPQAMVEAAEHHVMDKASKKFTRAFLLAILAGASIALAFLSCLDTPDKVSASSTLFKTL